MQFWCSIRRGPSGAGSNLREGLGGFEYEIIYEFSWAHREYNEGGLCLGLISAIESIYVLISAFICD